MFDSLNYACAEERRKDILVEADAFRLIRSAAPPPPQLSYPRLLGAEAVETIVHFSRFLRVLLQAALSFVSLNRGVIHRR